MWHDARMLNTIANGLVMAAFACLAAVAVWWAGHRPAFDLTAIEVGPVEGKQLEHVSIESLAAASANTLAGNFFTVDLQQVREAFQEAPWVRRAEVRRVWPNRLAVGIEEHEVLAHWSDGRFVNRQGELFSVDPAQVEEGPLLEFGGPEGTQGIVTRRWRELTGQLAALSLAPRKVLLSDRQAWSAELDNGMTLLIGRDDGPPLTQERVARWVAVHPRIQSRLTEPAQVVDLRYPNGFAIRAPGALDPEALDRRGSR